MSWRNVLGENSKAYGRGYPAHTTIMNKAQAIYTILKSTYPDNTTALVYEDPLELLIATILSAQCTDVRVNIVTKKLFKKYKNVQDYAAAEVYLFEEDIRSTGFYRNKTKNIISTAKMVISDFGSKVPDTMEKLVRLPGVARKTANIVLFHSFGKNCGIAVDTHVKRVAGRLALTKNSDPVKIEKDLMKLFDSEKWGKLSNLFIAHGRQVCMARKPSCEVCPLGELCPSKGVA